MDVIFKSCFVNSKGLDNGCYDDDHSTVRTRMCTHTHTHTDTRVLAACVPDLRYSPAGFSLFILHL